MNMRLILLLMFLFSGNVPAGTNDLRVFFSPNYGGEDCASNLVKTINQATNSIFVQTYTFTSSSIGNALLQAKRRGVNVQIISDPSAVLNRNAQIKVCANSGIPCRIDAKHRIAHNKVMIIDRQFVVTGSFNYTEAAEYSNAENLPIIKNEALAEQYIENWKRHCSHSTVYIGDKMEGQNNHE